MTRKNTSTLLSTLILTVLIICLAIQYTPARAVTNIVVNSPGDQDDDNYGDYVCHTSLGTCTLRAAIATANAIQDTSSTTITFSITPDGSSITDRVITIGSKLPNINVANVTIQGHNIGGLGAGAKIVLDGDGGGYDGLTIRANNCAIKKLTIRNFNGDGIDIQNVTAVTVSGNRIGPFGFSLVPLNGNTGKGIYVSDTISAIIGGDDAAARNIISGNGSSGVYISGGTSNVIRGNYIGTDETGAVAVPNSFGVYLTDTNGNTIGGSTAGRRNIISGNERSGISIWRGEQNYILGNYIGTNAAGTAALPNEDNGITIYSDTETYYFENVIGGNSLGSGNLISGNLDSGIYIRKGSETVIQGNIIGLDITQLVALPNVSGIYISSGEDNQIGGTDAYARNVIAGNLGNGILLYDQETKSTIIQGNRIGINDAGMPMPNVKNGIFDQYSLASQIGGTAVGAGNIIANNGYAGITLQFAYGNVVIGNSIFNNTGLGIDVREWEAAGWSANDADDSDLTQNYPVITKISYPDPSHVTIQGYIVGKNTTSLTLSFYGNDNCDPSGYGEGMDYLGQKTVMTNGAHFASFSQALAVSKAFNHYTATANDIGNGTSEFSACVPPYHIFLPIIIR